MTLLRRGSAPSIRARVTEELRRRAVRARSRESGQAIVMVMIVAALLVLITPIIVTNAISEDAMSSQGVSFEAALAAAEAGVQQYRNFLDVNSNYWEYNYQNDDGDQALDVYGPGCGPADPASPTCGWKSVDVPSGTTPEAFHYFPDACFLTANSCGGTSGVTAAILLTVTGRAGPPGHYVYRTIQVTLNSNGILTNSYFSDYEVLDNAQNTSIVNLTNYSEVAGAKTTANSANVTGSFSGVVAGETVNAQLTGTNIPGGTTVKTVVSATQITLSNNATSTATETLEFGAMTPETVQTAPALPIGPGNQNAPFWQAMCLYYTYQANTFIDSLTNTSIYPSSIIAWNESQGDISYNGGYFSDSPITQRYFGPWRGPAPRGSNHDQFTYAWPTTYADGSPTQTATVWGACATPYNFGGGETFTGPVYTEDQLWVCGNPGPDFTRGLTSNIPPVAQLNSNPLYQGYTSWATDTGSAGTNGWIDNGTLSWYSSCSGGAASPSFGKPPQIGGQENLPPVNGALAADAINGGCYFTGPTIIEFVSGGSYDVWSPLSGVAGAQPVGSTAECGTWPNTGVQNVNIPQVGGLVMYVGNTPGTVTQQCPTCIATALSSAFALGAVPSATGCLDPWKPYLASCPVLPPGDAIVNGEVQGQVTLGTAGNIVISRDLTYQCADDNGSVTSQQTTGYVLPSTGPNNCTTGEADILGLVAQGDVVISHPGATSPTNDNQVPNQTEPGEWPDPGSAYCSANALGQSVTPTTPAATAIADAVPNCVVSNPTIDSAIMAVTGSFADEDWDMGPNTSNGGQPSQGAYLQGTDISKFRGPFECLFVPAPSGHAGPSCPGVITGYQKEFTYDQRLTYLTPPDLLTVASLLWTPSSFVNCGGVNDNKLTDESDNASLCPGLLRLSS